MATRLPRSWIDIRRDWRDLTLYQQFETAIAFLLTFVIGAVIVVAFYRLVVSVVDTLVLRTLNPLDHAVFQHVFGQMLTLLIALEFNHTLQYVVAGERGIIQAKTVVLIAQLALARKIIVTDLGAVGPGSIAAIAALMLALALAYWLMREPDGGP